jgi:cobyric acid synthase
MRHLHVLSATAAAGKTVWVVALVRALRDAGLRVSVFKPVGEGSAEEAAEGIGLGARHLAAAAGLRVHSAINPIVAVPTQPDQAEVWLRGRLIGRAPRLGRDVVVLDDLRAEVEGEIFRSLKETASDADLIVSEGAGGATDLGLLGAWDIANTGMALCASATVLVARSSQGGALASLAGTIDLLPDPARRSLRGLALNDVRHRMAETIAAARRIADNAGLRFLGAVPFVAALAERPPHAPFTQESDEDHRILARALQDNVDINALLGWMELTHVL